MIFALFFMSTMAEMKKYIEIIEPTPSLNFALKMHYHLETLDKKLMYGECAV